MLKLIVSKIRSQPSQFDRYVDQNFNLHTLEYRFAVSFLKERYDFKLCTILIVEYLSFPSYCHQVELVRFLNQFADPQMDMPPGWDKKVDQSGRVII